MKLLNTISFALLCLIGTNHASSDHTNNPVLMRELQSAVAYYINATTATLSGNSITVSAIHGNSNNATKYFTFYKKPTVSSTTNASYACYSRGGIPINPTVGPNSEVNVLSTNVVGSPATTTFQLGYVPSNSSIWTTAPVAGGTAQAHLCVRFAFNYSGSPNQLVNYRELALVINVTLAQNFTASNLLSMKAIAPDVDTTNNTVTYSCSAYVCPEITNKNITDLAQGEGGNPVRLCFISNQYPAATIINVQSLQFIANNGALTQTVLSGGSSSSAGTGITDFVSVPGNCSYGPEYANINGPGECISYNTIPWAIFTPSSLYSTNVTVTGVCTLQIGGNLTNSSSTGGYCRRNGRGNCRYGGDDRFLAEIDEERPSTIHLTNKNHLKKKHRIVQTASTTPAQQQSAGGDDGKLNMPFQTTVDIGNPPSNSGSTTMMMIGNYAMVVTTSMMIMMSAALFV